MQDDGGSDGTQTGETVADISSTASDDVDMQETQDPDPSWWSGVQGES
jgi:hypothetical protein